MDIKVYKAQARKEIKMTNTEMLNNLIEKLGLKKSYIAKQVGFSRATFSKKINNKVAFNQYEIERLCEALNIQDLETKEAIFFA